MVFMQRIGKEVVAMRPYMIHPDVLIWMEESVGNTLRAYFELFVRVCACDSVCVCRSKD